MTRRSKAERTRALRQHRLEGLLAELYETRATRDELAEALEARALPSEVTPDDATTELRYLQGKCIQIAAEVERTKGAIESEVGKGKPL